MRCGVIGTERKGKNEQAEADGAEMQYGCRTGFFFDSGQQRMMKSEEAELVVNTCKQNEWNVAKQILLK